MSDQIAKFARFKTLHEGNGAFIIPNAWDAGSARLLASLDFEALATTSAGYAFSKGKRDSFASLSRDEILANAAEIVNATDLPVSADLEDGFGAAPEAARDLPFLLTARAESYLWGKPDLDDTIARLQAFSDAGAHVLYAPGLPDLEAIRIVCAAVDKPVNVVMGLNSPSYSVAELSDAGVSRISVGGSFARAALGALTRAAQEVKNSGTFTYAADALPGDDIAKFLSWESSRDRV